MSEIDKYKVPKNAVKIPNGDTGYNLVKKGYRRFIWTWNDAPKNEDDDYDPAGAEPTKMKYIKECDEEVVEKVGDGMWNNIDTKEISGMGMSALTPGGTVGYKNGPTAKNTNEPTDVIEDPDAKEKRKLKNLKKFNDYFNNPKNKVEWKA